MLTTLVVVGLSAAVMTVAPPAHLSAAIVQLRPAVISSGGGAIQDTLIESEMEIIRSPAILASVVDKLALADDPEFSGRPDMDAYIPAWIGGVGFSSAVPAHDGVLATLARAVVVKRIGRTLLLSVEVAAASAVRANDLANEIAAAYVNGRQFENLAGVTTGPSARVLSMAHPVAGANRSLLIASSGIVGLAFGLGLALVGESRTRGFASEEEVETELGLPVAATIPRVVFAEDDVAGEVSPADLIPAAPVSPFAEAMRWLRATLDRPHTRSNSNDRAQVIAFTSTAPEEGKTTLALALARSYALSGKRVLLIDCDLRRSGLHRQFGATGTTGFLAHLEGRLPAARLRDIVVREGDTGLYLILGGQRNLPAEHMFTGGRFANLVSWALTQFDLVILDTPPLGPVVDALYILHHVDDAVFVIGWRGVERKIVKAAAARLRRGLRAGAEMHIALNRHEDVARLYDRLYAKYLQESAAT